MCLLFFPAGDESREERGDAVIEECADGARDEWLLLLLLALVLAGTLTVVADEDADEDTDMADSAWSLLVRRADD